MLVVKCKVLTLSFPLSVLCVRLDACVIFHPLGPDQLRSIMVLQLQGTSVISIPIHIYI